MSSRLELRYVTKVLVEEVEQPGDQHHCQNMNQYSSYVHVVDFKILRLIHYTQQHHLVLGLINKVIFPPKINLASYTGEFSISTSVVALFDLIVTYYFLHPSLSLQLQAAQFLNAK